MKKSVKKASFFSGQVHRLLNKILKGMKRRKEIYSFTSVLSQLGAKNLLASFRVFTSENRFFEILFKEAITFSPSHGAEVGECYGWKVVILLGKNYTAKKINYIILNEIKSRRVGQKVEESCRKAIQYLIDHDEEVGSIIFSIKISTDTEDRDWKIDLFLETQKGNVPLQIKSSLMGQVSHKINDHRVTSLVFKEKMETSELKDKILLICKSYPKIIEHL
ncbi:MAG: hypothetical protein WC908_00625 [Candidatus Paceibacterota bacterium]